jgi:hypothetical protein
MPEKGLGHNLGALVLLHRKAAAIVHSIPDRVNVKQFSLGFQPRVPKTTQPNFGYLRSAPTITPESNLFRTV